MEIKKAEFVKSAVLEKEYPEFNGLEFSFIGRSNVGKSSLINLLTNRRGLARTSKTPGRTQLINYFLIDNEIHFVDLPGYGFAKVPDAVKRNWGKTIETYLKSDREKVVFLLLDLRRVPTKDDLEMLQFVGQSVAMGNASDDIKALCKYVTLTNDEAGVAHAIRTWAL